VVELGEMASKERLKTGHAYNYELWLGRITLLMM
jgi:hypothetical protein